MNRKERQDEIKRLRSIGYSLQYVGYIFNVTRQAIESTLKTDYSKFKTSYCNSCNKEIFALQVSYFCKECNSKLKIENKKEKKITTFSTLKGRDMTREMARARDNWTCQDCGKIWVFGTRRFDIHHINNLCGKKSKKYDKVSELHNLVTLCHQCHFNRPEHTSKRKYLTKAESTSVLISV